MKKSWFTLIEVLIVIVIIGVLAWALIPRVWSAKDYANDSVRVSYAQWISFAMMQYRLDHEDYPVINPSMKIWSCNCATLENGLGDNLSRYWYSINTLPKDPVADSSFLFCWEEVTWWQFVYCKINDWVLFVSHLERHGWNASLADFNWILIDENTKRAEIEAKLSTQWGDLYVYPWW